MKRKWQKSDFNHSNLGFHPAKIINLKWAILAKRCIMEWRFVQRFLVIHGRGFFKSSQILSWYTAYPLYFWRFKYWFLVLLPFHLLDYLHLSLKGLGLAFKVTKTMKAWNQFHVNCINLIDYIEQSQPASFHLNEINVWTFK